MAKTSSKQDFLALTDWNRERLLRVLDLGVRLKKRHLQDLNPRPFERRTLGLVFEKPSLRTRVSLELAMRQLGGHGVYLSPAEVGLGKRESVADVARVLGGYVDVIAARTFKHESVLELARWSPVPVINALSDYSHPCQLLADLLTMLEVSGRLEGLSVAWVGDGNNVANSWLNAVRLLPFSLKLACPEGYDPHPGTLEAARAEAGDRVSLLRDPTQAVKGADYVYADTWVSMGDEAQRAKRLADFKGFRVDDELLQAAPAARVLHCLPAHRGEEISDEVMDGPRSVVFQQANNRLHAQKALLLSLLDKEDVVE
jgi:ornithine carbamoyltransferase